MSTWVKSSKCQVVSKVYKTMTDLPVLERLPTQWSPWSFSSALSLSSPQQRHWYVLGHSNVFFVEIFFDDISVPLSKCLGETSYPGDLHRDPGHNWFCWQHLLVPLHNCLWPQPQGFRPIFLQIFYSSPIINQTHSLFKVVYRRQSTVHCDPNTNGKQTTETIIIAVNSTPV